MTLVMTTNMLPAPLLRQTNMAANIRTSGFQMHADAGCQSKLRFISINRQLYFYKYLDDIDHIATAASNYYIQLIYVDGLDTCISWQ